MHNDKAALELAQKAYELDKSDSFSISTLALVYHYNNMTTARDSMFEQLKKQTPQDEYNIQLLADIFKGDLQWR